MASKPLRPASKSAPESKWIAEVQVRSAAKAGSSCRRNTGFLSRRLLRHDLAIKGNKIPRQLHDF